MKRKKINRSVLFLSLCGIFVTIVAMSVVYAALSSKLLIDGSAEVQASSFGLKVEKMSLSELMGDDYLSTCQANDISCQDNMLLKGNAKLVNEPTISGTTINNFEVSVQLPGDQIGLIYKVTNVGTIPVKLIDIIESEFQIISLNNSNDDVSWVNENVIFDFTMEYLDSSYNVEINDILCPGEETILSIMIGVPATVETIPSGAVEISNISVAYDFVQTDQYLCEEN